MTQELKNGMFRPLCAALLGILITMVSAWAAWTNRRIDAQDERIRMIEQAISANSAEHKLIMSLQEQTIHELRLGRPPR